MLKFSGDEVKISLDKIKDTYQTMEERAKRMVERVFKENIFKRIINSIGIDEES